ncbi:hypothetical protein Bravens_00385 [Brevibacterium ravenspurgense]|uniref:Uncharacterized protein n=1 Tax=Brevibacterium ravenspurgense TaxID=479117 RepID=A0A150HBM0_9MICO|nr:hypothetical protein Bravens_00385 [Brevibacterium ravenspurgense]
MFTRLSSWVFDPLMFTIGFSSGSRHGPRMRKSIPRLFAVRIMSPTRMSSQITTGSPSYPSQETFSPPTLKYGLSASGARARASAFASRSLPVPPSPNT